MPSSVTALTNALADRYRIEREIGQGGMATVYLAHDLRHDRDVAIKVVFPELAAALGGERFLSEIKTTAKLHHPHILPLLDSGDANGLLYYVMPFVQGETLRSRLDREKILPIDDAVRIGREVADALEHAHHLGIIHRDIKPENILLQEGHALVADFGIALAVQEAGGQRLTQTGLSLGTPQYMSPEQAMGEKHIDARADIYALGAVVYEMLVGDPPFTGSTVQAIVAKVMTEKPMRIVTQRDRVPAHIEATVLRALEKLPADRWGSAREFAQALRDGRLITGASVTASVTATALAPRARVVRVASVAALCGMVGVAAGYAIASWRAKAHGDEQPLMTSIVPPPAGNFGERRSLALSPDGRRLAFVFSALDGTVQLWIEDLGKSEVVPVNGSVGADAPFWSPDGESIGFFANGSLIVLGNDRIKRLCPVTNPTGGSWSSDGTIIFAHRDGIVTVPATGGTCTTIVPSTGRVITHPVFVPGSHRFMWSRDRQVIYSDLDGKIIAELPLVSFELAIPASGQFVADDQKERGALAVYRFNVRTGALEGTPTRVASGIRTSEAITTFSASPSGALVYLGGAKDKPYFEYDATGMLRDTIRVEQQWTVSPRPARAGAQTIALGGWNFGAWTYDFVAHRSARLPLKDPESTRLGDKPDVAWPVFSADGQRIAYEAVNSKGCGIAERDLARGTERMISPLVSFSFARCRTPRDWSSDGASILVHTDSVLEIMDVNGKVTSRIARSGIVWEGRFSPDARAVAFSSSEGGHAEIYVQSLLSGAAERVSTEGGRWPFWSLDGKKLTWLTPDGRVQEVGMNGTKSVGAPHTRFSVITWRRSMFDDAGTGFVVVGNGERFVVRQSPTADALTYVQHWPSMLPHSP